MKKVFALIVSGLCLLALTLPYLWAAKAAGADHVFGGFLLNPIDGNSYLAKMYQGWQGSWTVDLLYTPVVGHGAFFYFGYYLFLGHLARWLGLSLIFVFHGARVAGSLFLFWALWRFFTMMEPETLSTGFAYVLAVAGSGFGWVAASLGLFTSDFWVAEAYPFLSCFANPHFPLGLALLVWIITPPLNVDIRGGVLIALFALVLGLVMPFGVVIGGIVLAGVTFWNWFENRQWLIRKILWFASGGIIFLVYELYVIVTNPVYAGWNAQNITRSPQIGDLFISLSPVLILGFVGALIAVRRRNIHDRLLLTWFVFGIVLIYLPFGLQRRFMTGLYIPIVGLAAVGIQYIFRRWQKWGRLCAAATIILSLPTNLLILFASIKAVQTFDSNIFLTRNEVDGFTWLAENAPDDAVILASPDTGLYIPAWSGRRVVYGHPFETVEAEKWKAQTTAFFKEKLSAEQIWFIIKESGADYLFYGPREQLSSIMSELPGISLVYYNSDVRIYEIANR
jgi:hypothetical protein